MPNIDAWNKIVEEFRSHIYDEEKVIQIIWETLFSTVFNYTKKDIDSQRSFKMGATDRGKPDIIIKDGTKDLFVVELKKPTVHAGREQLFSYLDRLKVNVGIVVCDNLYIYYYDYAEKNKFEELEIPFEEGLETGGKFVELFLKGNFSKEDIKSFIEEQNSTKGAIEKLKSEITENLVKNLLKKYFKDNYSEASITKVLSELDISVKTESVVHVPAKPKHKINAKSVIDKGMKTIIIHGIELPLYRSKGQSVQDFVQQTLETLYYNNLLAENEIKLLQDEEYSKHTFGIQYPLLERDFAKTRDNTGHSRYWTRDFRLGNFYVCSQWWKQYFDIYDEKIANWLIGLRRE